jgi:hypothetical protein
MHNKARHGDGYSVAAFSHHYKAALAGSVIVRFTVIAPSKNQYPQ